MSIGASQTGAMCIGASQFIAVPAGDPEGPLIGGKLIGRGILGGRLVA